MPGWAILLIIGIFIVVAILVIILVVNSQKSKALPKDYSNSTGGSTSTNTGNTGSGTSNTPPPASQGQVGTKCSQNSDCSTNNCSGGFCQLTGSTTGDLGAACSNTINGFGCNGNLLSCQTNNTGLGVCVQAAAGLGDSCNSNILCASQLVCDNKFSVCTYPMPDPNACPANATGNSCTVPGATDAVCVNSVCKMDKGLSCGSNGDCITGTCGQSGSISQWTNDNGWNFVVNNPVLSSGDRVVFSRMFATSDGSTIWALNVGEPAIYQYTRSGGWIRAAGPTIDWTNPAAIPPQQKAYIWDMTMSDNDNCYVLYYDFGTFSIWQITVENGAGKLTPYQTALDGAPGSIYYGNNGSAFTFDNILSFTAKSINGVDQFIIMGNCDTFGNCGIFTLSGDTAPLVSVAGAVVPYYSSIGNAPGSQILAYSNPSDPNRIDDYAYFIPAGGTTTFGQPNVSIVFNGSLSNIVLPPPQTLSSVKQMINASIYTNSAGTIQMAYKFIDNSGVMRLHIIDDINSPIDFGIPFHQSPDVIPVDPTVLIQEEPAPEVGVTTRPISITEVGMFNSGSNSCI